MYTLHTIVKEELLVELEVIPDPDRRLVSKFRFGMQYKLQGE